MKNVLYLSNIEVPYRVSFFNEFSQHCNLTVLYEREKSDNRDKKWTESIRRNYNIEYIKGIKIGNENAFSFKILKYIFRKYDSIIVGCYNSPVYMLAIVLMKLFHIPYILNLDGEVFVGEKGIKSKLKKFFLKGADKYLCAGEKSADSIRKIVGDKIIIPYYFSSLTDNEIEANANSACERDKTVLVVGQYFDYKGMDIAFNAAKQNLNIKYKFVGMGKRTELFINDMNAQDAQNIEFVPFLQKIDLENEYKNCGMLLLPSRQECWGLVINEAASFGMPIVSTYGSGAAVEFLGEKYPQFLAIPNDFKDLYKCIERLIFTENTEDYSNYLLEKSRFYSIEKGVKAHLDACEISI